MFWTALTKFLASYSDVLGWNFRSSWLANHNPISSVQPDRHSMQLIEIETLRDRLRNRNLFQERCLILRNFICVSHVSL